MAELFTISWLIQRAVDHGGHGSFNQLAQAIGTQSSMMTVYRKGHQIPSDPMLFRLCNEAGEPIEEWLICAHAMRNEPEMASVWQSMLEKIKLSDPIKSPSKAA